jgi:hypothetical protein
MRFPFALIGSAAVLSCAAAANADFTGWQTEIITLGNGHTIMNVYAGFDNSGDRVINVFNTDITTNAAGGFFQSNTNPFWQPGTQNKLTSDDSWVCIGTNPSGSGNASGSITSGDPSFVNFNDANESSDYSFIESSGTGAGWYNNNPGNTWGFANQGGNRVLVAHFVFATGQGAGLSVSWDATLTIKKNGQTGSETAGQGQFEFFIPGPGALALLGVAGLAARRRRA